MTSASTGVPGGLELELDTYRRELTAHCYRMLGSGSEAEDAVQETMVRAWRNHDRFEGRSSLRSWLYRIATNVCLDMLKTPQRRARPMDLGPSSPADTALPPGLSNETWVLPIADDRVVAADGDPAEVAAGRESVRLAFVAALQHLPARQRAVLLLREVLRWPASEVAELLDTTVASVNSALQRARATLDSIDLDDGDVLSDDPAQQDLLRRYVEAFEAYDMEALTRLLRDDVRFSMPPIPLWLQGPEAVERFLLGHGIVCQGSRLVPTAASGLPAFGCYHPAGPGRWEPWAVQVIEVGDGRICGFHSFLDTEAFPDFGLPEVLED